MIDTLERLTAQFDGLPQDKLARRVVVMAASADGKNAPVPNYKAKLSIDDLIATEHERNQKRIDGTFDLAALRVVSVDAKRIGLFSSEIETFQNIRTFNDTAEAQFAARMHVPAKFFSECSSDLKLRIVQEHSNEFTVAGDSLRNTSKKSFVRLDYDGRVRALLSEKYAIADNIEVLEATRELFGKHHAMAAYLNLGESLFHGRVLFPDLTQTVGRDSLVPGVQLRNSEVGTSALAWAPTLFRVTCWNGIIMPTKLAGISEDVLLAMRQRHSGSAAQAVFANLDDAMFDIVKNIPALTDRVARVSAHKIQDGQEYLENSVRHGLPKSMIPRVLQEAQAEGASSAWDYINTVTALAQGLSLDTRIALETTAGKMLGAVK
jgi:hypothetical protein